MMKEEEYDLIIIGAGPIGIATAIEAQKQKLRYLILEKGCIANSLYHYPENMRFFSTSEKLEIDKIPFVSIHQKPSKQEALEYYRRIVEFKKLHLHLFEEVKTIRQHGESTDYQVETQHRTYFSKNVILATGFYDNPNLLNIPGENLPNVFHYYNDPHYFANQKVIIVGASNSACDAALEIYRKGGKVTLIIRDIEISPHVKYWVKPDIENRIREQNIRVHFQTNLTTIRSNEVDICSASGEKTTLQSDFVLAMTGYQPNFAFLEKIGITFSNTSSRIPTHNPETMESNKKGIYLADVICGGLETHKWFIENSRTHAVQIIKNILRTYL